MPDPYAQIAKPIDPYASIAKPVAPPAPEPSLLQKAGTMASDFGTGILKGAGNTANNIGHMIIPDAALNFANQHLGTHIAIPTTEYEQKVFAPSNTTQSIGKGVEQVGEFLAPGGIEEEGAAKLASLAPKLGRFALPTAKVVTSGLSSGLVNKAQGGDFSTGAAMGAGGQVIGQGIKAVAPALAESALNITKSMRGSGRDIGNAVLNETSGIRPTSIADSAKSKISSLYGERQGMLDQSSVKPNPVRGLLPAPSTEIPLAEVPGKDPKMSPMAFPAKMRTGFDRMSGIPEAGSVPGALEESGTPALGTGGRFTHGIANPQYLSGSEHPELSGRIPVSHGVLIRPGEVGSGPIPSTLPNNSASLVPARSVLSDAMAKARGMEALTLHGQVNSMHDFLHTGAVSGNPIPENITPSHLGRLQQGFSDEHLNWNPFRHEEANAAGKKAYGAMTGELERTSPGTAPINKRISNLIAAARASESVSRNASIAQRVMGRFGANTGALTLGGIAADGAYKEGGVPGAIAGGLAGVIAPELVASPEAKMILARTMNKAGGLKPAVGALLQADRKKDK